MMWNVLTLFGTRPEVIKLAPVIRELGAHGDGIETINVASGQHRELVEPFARLFEFRVDQDLRALRPGQSASRLCARILEPPQLAVNFHERDGRPRPWGARFAWAT